MSKLNGFRGTRRAFLAGAAASLLGGCSYSNPVMVNYFRPTDPYAPRMPGRGMFRPEPYREERSLYREMYGEMVDEGFVIPAVDLSKVPEQYLRREVFLDSPERPGTVIVDTANRYLYLIREQGNALRYGVGIGREGFAWSGRAVIQWKRKWPRWTPPDTMISRQPELARYSAANGGKDPGLDNPLGARALYIFQNGEDTLYRIHGTPEYWTIGRAVSSGCVRMMNQDVIDLFNRVPNRSPILVI